MPIEIKELHIRLTVNAPAATPPAANGERGQGNNKPGAGADRQAIVAECVEQVMQIIQEKQQR